MTTSSAFDSTLANLGIGRTYTADSPAVQTRQAQQTLDQSDFLELMTAQLKNQDPFSPVDNTQMVAQMAQFSSVAGIAEMNSTLKAISEKLAGGSASDALSFVGRTVLTPGNVAYGRTDGGIAGAVELDKDATDVMVTIANADGEVLKSFSLGKQDAGTVAFDWDGTTATGEDVGDGPFIVTTTAINGSAEVDSQPLVWAPVAAVSLPANGEPQLTIPGVGSVPVSEIRQVG
jgi:flagellar basal-body rod modification protein FlgD